MIRVYCVGIHYRHHIDFSPDLTDSATSTKYMSGAAVLAASATKWNLRYKLSTNPPSPVNGHIDYVGYTPDRNNDNDAKDPLSSPRVTFGGFGGAIGKVFPFFGQPLSLTEILSPIGQSSQVLQYTLYNLDATKPIPKVYIAPSAVLIGPSNDGKSSFGTTGIPDNTEVRIRSLNIFCTY